MFRFLPLIFKQVWRARTRSVLTLVGVATAMFLFCTVDALDEAVTKSLESGWQPFGSPYVVADPEGPVICQAMTSTIGTLGTQGK